MEPMSPGVKFVRIVTPSGEALVSPSDSGLSGVAVSSWYISLILLPSTVQRLDNRQGWGSPPGTACRGVDLARHGRDGPMHGPGGWAVLRGDKLHGMTFVHGGDDSEFVAKGVTEMKCKKMK